MPRLIQIATSAEKANAVLRNVSRIDGILGVSRQTGASIVPAGDIVTIQVTNDTSRKVFAELEKLGIQDQGTILTSDLKSLLNSNHQKEIDNESNETVWEEMASMLQQDTNVTFNFLALMFLAGAIAATGLWVDKIHIVIGAMVIAPAFEPLLRMPFGLISRSRATAASGAVATVTGYAATITGAALALVLLRFFDPGALAGTHLEARSWVRYWSTFTSPGIIASVFGAAAGAVVVCGLRSVLTTGVMVTLSLIPSISIIGMAIATADMSLAGKGLVRWLVDAALVISMSAIVLGLKAVFLHRRRSMG